MRYYYWKNVEEELPERTSLYLVFVPVVVADRISFSACRVAYFDAIHKTWIVIEGKGESAGEVEYWMELPSDPTEEDEE